MRVPHLLLLSVFLFMAGCNETSVAYHEETVVHYKPVLYLEEFSIVDSYLTYSAESDSPLYLDPEIDDGFFEIYWAATSSDDYRVTLSVNREPTADGAVVLSTEVCGPGLSCDEIGSNVCRYTSDFFLGCGIDDFEANANARDVNHLFLSVPEILFMNIEVCDYSRRSCIVDSIPVSAE